ncbi:tRNA epoxyqueuosine(34) reductase QueG [bacterium]|nr:tRNA epoxyqueuosine(34) reductase QueG [bacterium]
MSVQISENELNMAASAIGIDLMGIAPEAELNHEEIARLRLWQESGYAGEMSYLQRDPAERGEPTRFVPGTTTILTFAVPYRALAKQPLQLGFGRIARYALGKDYHRVIKKRLQKLKETFTDSEELIWRPVADSFPILERAYAQRAGIGFIGKNTMLIREKIGSFFFLGEVLTNINVVQKSNRLATIDTQCGSCQKCIQDCPTEAFVQPYTMDARKCISYLTIEKRGKFTEWESKAVAEWLFGCDICQEVCPFNHTRLKGDHIPIWEEFDGNHSQLDLKPLFYLRTEEEFRDHFKGRAILRAGREGLLRNALAVLRNTKAHSTFLEIGDLALSDESSYIREDALFTDGYLKSL